MALVCVQQVILLPQFVSDYEMIFSRQKMNRDCRFECNCILMVNKFYKVKNILKGVLTVCGQSGPEHHHQKWNFHEEMC
jgi:hypothetical protein